MAEIPVLAPASTTEPEAPRSRRKWLPILGVLVALAAGGAGAWFYLVDRTDPASETAGRAQNLPPIYVALDPPFVVNFQAEQLVRFLQVTVEVMTRDPQTADLIKANDPVVRNDLLLLFANQKYADIASREGKERLRQEALLAVRRVIASTGGRPERVEAVYFTSFVMQ